MARMYENGSQIGQSAIVNATNARGVFDATSAAHHKQNVQWPQYVPPFSPTYEDTLSINTPTTWTPFGQRSNSSNVSVNSRVTNFLVTTASSAPFGHKLYLGYRFKNTLNDGPSSVPTYYHDMTFVGVQIVIGTGPFIYQTWVGNAWNQWETTTAQNTNALTTSPTNLAYTTISSGGTASRWNIDTAGTGSAHTGILNGTNITSPAWNVSTSGTSNTLAQATSAPYCYVETSGAPNNQTTWMRKIALNLDLNSLYSIRVAHYLNTSNTYSTDAQAFGDVCAILLTN